MFSKTILSLVFTALLAAPALAQEVSREQQIQKDIETISSKTDASFWSLSNSALSKAYAPYLANPVDSAARLTFFVSAIASFQGLSGEALMGVYKTKTQLEAMGRLWVDLEVWDAKLLVKKLPKNHWMAVRSAEKIAFYEKLAKAPAVRSPISRMKWRAGTAGVIAAAAVAGSYVLFGNPADKKHDQLSEEFFATPAALVEAFTRPKEQVYQAALAHEGLALQIHAFASLLSGETE